MTLTTRLTLAMVALVLLTTAAVGVLIHRNVESVVVPDELSRMTARVQRLATELDRFVRSARDKVAGFGSAVALDGIVRARLHGGIDPEGGIPEQEWRDRLAQRLRAELKVNPEYAQFRVIGCGDDGRELVRVDRSGPGGSIRVAPPNELRREGDASYFREALKGKKGDVYISPVGLRREHGVVQLPPVPELHVSVPVFTPAGDAFGIMIIDLDPQPIFAQLQKSSDYRGGVVYVVNENGDYLAHPDPGKVFGFELGHRHRIQDEFPRVAAGVLGQRKSARIAELLRGGRVGVAGYGIRPGGGPHMTVVEMVPVAALMSAATSIRRGSFMVAALAAACAALLAAGIARSLSKPLVQLTDAVDVFASGGAGNVPLQAGGEIGRLAQAFQRMSDEVRSKATALRESEERFRALVDHSIQGITLSSGDRFDYVNRAYTEITGYSQHEVTGKPLAELLKLVHPDDRPGAVARQERYLRGVPVDEMYEQRIIRADGSECRVMAASKSFTLQGQNLCLDMMIDITKRTRAETALQTSEEKFRTLVDNLQVGVLLQGANAGTLLCNPKALELLGLTEAQLIGKTSLDPDWNVIHEDGSPFPGPAHPVPQAIATRRPVRGVVMGVYRPATKDRVWLLVDAAPQLNDEGGVHDVICTFGDITGRKQAEEKIAVQLDELRRWHEAMIGRESRVLELKREVNELLAVAGQPPRYPSAEPGKPESVA